jgi:nitrogen fixation/metabolism regulation signal transduction histidine kinase
MELLREQDFGTHLRPVGQIEADAIVNIFNRMMEQLKNERLHVREQNHFLDLLIGVSPMGVAVFDFDWHIMQCNGAALRMLGFHELSDLKGKKLEQLDSPLALQLVALQPDTEVTVRLNDGRILRCSKLSFLDRGFAHPFILMETLTDEVRVAEKKAYEKVIRMIAHEVNNSTAAITSTLDSVQSVLKGMDNMTDLTDVITVCIERSYRMSYFITNFADVVKIPQPQLLPVDLNKELDACRMFIENLCIEHQIHLRLFLSDVPLVVLLDASLFEQVVINIVKNAAESISHDGEICMRLIDNPPQLEIADNGAGISAEAEDKLFTPFFSTKPNGQGIGLIFIREVLIGHHCTFSLKTYPDGWTRFRIGFPIYSA